MRDFGAVTTANWHLLLTALADPWIIVGICFLIGFFCTYVTALSWADLTYVLPATAISYVLMALHEDVTLSHWLGIGLITAGVGFVATGPPLTVAVNSHTAGSHADVSLDPGGTRSDA
jgi:drug/metabolite transporter (DMT)-like permease